jgi:hypothetical protein
MGVTIPNYSHASHHKSTLGTAIRHQLVKPRKKSISVPAEASLTYTLPGKHVANSEISHRKREMVIVSLVLSRYFKEISLVSNCSIKGLAFSCATNKLQLFVQHWHCLYQKAVALILWLKHTPFPLLYIP